MTNRYPNEESEQLPPEAMLHLEAIGHRQTIELPQLSSHQSLLPDQNSPLSSVDTDALSRTVRERLSGELHGAQQTNGIFPGQMPADDPRQMNMTFVRPFRKPKPAPPAAPDMTQAQAIERDASTQLPAQQRDALAPLVGGGIDAARLHTGQSAAVTAQTFRADAFTVGRDVFFAKGRFDPFSLSGQALLAHELTHVAQEATAPTIQRAPDPEQQAQAAERAALQYGGAAAIPPFSVSNMTRNYSASDGMRLTQAERVRLDMLSLQVLARTEQLLADYISQPGFREIPQVEAAVRLNLQGLSDDQIVEQWAQSVASAVRLEVGG